MISLDELTKQVQANTDGEAAAVTLIIAMAARFDAASADPEAVKALAAQLKSSADALGAAVVANTQPVPPPAPQPAFARR